MYKVIRYSKWFLIFQDWCSLSHGFTYNWGRRVGVLRTFCKNTVQNNWFRDTLPVLLKPVSRYCLQSRWGKKSEMLPWALQQLRPYGTARVNGGTLLPLPLGNSPGKDSNPDHAETKSPNPKPKPTTLPSP